jgi:hypothetical protein
MIQLENLIFMRLLPVFWLLLSRVQAGFYSHSNAAPKQLLSGNVVPFSARFLMIRSNDERELLTLPCDADMPPLP